MFGLVELFALWATAGSAPLSAGTQVLAVPTGRQVRTADFQINRWSEHEGLPQVTVSDIVGSSDGFLYLATFGGLVRFDGSDLRVLPGLPASGGLSYRPTALAADDSGGVWIGLERGGLVHWDGTVLHGVDTPEFLRDTVWDLSWHPERGLLVGGQGASVCCVATPGPCPSRQHPMGPSRCTP